MNTKHTLKELADIGAKAANSKLPTARYQMTVGLVSTYPDHAEAREAFTKAILDAIGYEFPKDEEREAFERWLSEQGDGFHPCGDIDKAFTVWKAGREELRKDLAKDQEEPLQTQPPSKTNPAWIPWEGGVCPLPDRVKKWEYKNRDGFSTDLPIDRPSLYRWYHTGAYDDILAYRFWE